MPGAGQSVTLDLSEFAGWAKAMGRDLDSMDFTAPLKQVRVALVASAKQNFSGQHAPDGTPWTPLRGHRARNKGGAGDGKILRDRGLLMASLTGRGQGHVEELTSGHLVYGTNLNYAATHQYGATIRPVRSKMLAVPLTPEALRAGGPRQFAGELFVYRSKGGELPFLAQRKTGGKGRGKGKGGGKLVLHYRLLPSVTIPARPFLGVSVQLAEDIGGIFAEHLVKMLGRYRTGL